MGLLQSEPIEILATLNTFGHCAGLKRNVHIYCLSQLDMPKIKGAACDQKTLIV